MAYYAKVLNGVVTKIKIADAEVFAAFVDDSPGTWVETAKHMRGGKYIDPVTGDEAADQSVVTGNAARERKNYAGVGYHYDGTGFYAPQPYDSWTLNTTTYLWEPPTAYPSDGKSYHWDEASTNWVLD